MISFNQTQNCAVFVSPGMIQSCLHPRIHPTALMTPSQVKKHQKMMESNPKSSVNDTILLKTLVQAIENGGPRVLNTNTICMKHQTKRRGLYDFLTIGAIFGICSKVTPDSFYWNGLGNTKYNVERIRALIEKDATNPNYNLANLFDCSLNATLPNLALHVVELFYFLEATCLDLRMISRLFSQSKTKYKTMLRKLYTVASSLEIAGIISRTTTVAEIKYNFDTRGLNDIRTALIGNNNVINNNNMCSIYSLLNNDNNNNILSSSCSSMTPSRSSSPTTNVYPNHSVIEKRREEFHKFFGVEKSSGTQPLEITSGTMVINEAPAITTLESEITTSNYNPIVNRVFWY